MKLYVVVDDNPPILEKALVDRETAKLYYLRERGGNGFGFKRQIAKDTCRSQNIATSAGEAIELWRSSLADVIREVQKSLRRLLYNYRVHTFDLPTNIEIPDEAAAHVIANLALDRETAKDE